MYIKTITAAFIFGISLLVAGCQDPKSSTPNPKPDLFQLFDISKKGQKVVFEFWTKAEDDEGNALMLGVQAMDGKSVSSEQIDLIRKAEYEFPFNVTVQKLVNDNWVNAPFKAYGSQKNLKTFKATNFIGPATVYGHFFGLPATIAIARLERFKELAKYRVTLETPADNANLPPIKMEAFVEYRAYGGK